MNLKHISLAAIAALVITSPLSASQSKIGFSVESQNMTSALSELAKQAKIQLLVDSKLLDGKKANPVTGQMGLDEAFDKLLRGSGLVAEISGETVVIKETAGSKKQGSVTSLGAVEVWSTQVQSSSLNMGKDVIETKQADHLSDLLRDLPGVDVGGTHSINNRIAIRGLDDDNLEMTIDGAKISNTNMFHHIGNLLINPDILKKAEIQVGSNSVVHGGLGGAVAFETKEGKDLLQKDREYGARVSAGFASNDSRSGSAAVYGKIGRDGDFLLYRNQLNKNNWTDSNGQKTFGSDGTIANTLVKVGYDLGTSQRISLSYDLVKDEGDYAPRPDFGYAYNFARTGTVTFPTEYTRETYTLKHELDIGDALYVQTSIYHNQNELERYERIDGVTTVRPGAVPAGTSNKQGLLNGQVKTQGVNVKAQSLLGTSVADNKFTYGALYDEQKSNVTWDGKKYGKDEESTTTAFFVEDAIDFKNGLVLTPGVRHNVYKYTGVHGELNDDKPTYSLAGSYAATKNLTFNAGVTTLYKGVEMVEVLSSARVTTQKNNNLKAETGTNREIGVKYENSLFGGDKIAFSLTGFDTDINDYINYDAANSNYKNDGKLNIFGYEASILYQKGYFSSLLTYSHSDSKFDTTGLTMQREQGDTFSINLDYELSAGLSLGWDALFVAKEEKKYDALQNEKGGYVVHDVSVKYKPVWAKSLTMIGGIDNVFNKKYVSHASENRTIQFGGKPYSTADYEPGRNVKFTLSYEF
ncbi:MAG: TonB-dependent receptor [Campylobacterales bacterium]